MNGDLKVVMNHGEAAAFLKSGEIGDLVEGEAARLANAAGAGYSHDRYMAPGRVIASAFPETLHAKRSDAKNNTLVRLLGGRL